MLFDFLKEKLSPKQLIKLRNIAQDIRAFGPGFNLTRLGRIYRTDKTGSHFYTPHYQTHFRPFKFKQVQVLEIGVGGYENPFWGGNSLRMWKKYFPFGKIFSIDIYDKSNLQSSRIKIYQGSQVDEVLLRQITDTVGEFDIIIDDGSHINEHVIQSFELLFPKLKDGGIYVIEDTQTSYWPEYGGDSADLQNAKTLLNYFKALTDSLNHQEFIRPGYSPTLYDQKIISMHFYHNMVFIYKGNNNEKSNILVNNQPKETTRE